MRNVTLKYIFTRIFYFVPMLFLRSRFLSAGTNFFIEFPYKLLNPKYIKVGTRFRVFKGSRIECIPKYGDQIFEPKLIIGNNVTINNNVHIGVINKVILEDNVLLASYVYITDHNHGDYGQDFNSNPNSPPSSRNLFSPGCVHIRKNAWIGEGVKILPNVTIGTGSIVGANSVVTKDIPDYTIAVGIPAKVIKKFNFATKKWEDASIHGN